LIKRFPYVSSLFSTRRKSDFFVLSDETENVKGPGDVRGDVLQELSVVAPLRLRVVPEVNVGTRDEFADGIKDTSGVNVVCN
jgi:hypothetical protein